MGISLAIRLGAEKEGRRSLFVRENQKAAKLFEEILVPFTERWIINMTDQKIKKLEMIQP